MTVAKTRTPGKAVPLPTIGRQGAIGTTKKSLAAAKLKEKGNGNIMSFFRKEETGLFFGEATPTTNGDDNNEARFNEYESPQKRRRLSVEPEIVSTSIDTIPEQQLSRQKTAPGPFMEDSDDENEEREALTPGPQDVHHVASPEHDLEQEADTAIKPEPVEDEPFTTTIPSTITSDIAHGVRQSPPVQAADGIQESLQDSMDHGTDLVHQKMRRPALLKQETSFAPDLTDFAEFENLEGDFDEDLYEEGDEFIERRYMEEQARLEAEEGETNHAQTQNCALTKDDAACPICNESLAGVAEQEAAVHVNGCLDGKPVSLKKEAQTPVKTEGSLNPKQFRWPSRPPKPGQQNPFAMDDGSGVGGSAFNKLMSGHAEDAAWAEAAAHEHASRGKPSWQRTCPFYKILPGFSICVDAFRYGAVQGAAAYFLSHFHSDHYVGLTSSWTHGPIYCSHVTANLVRQQLKVDPKYVFDLDFEETVEVPGTKGVQVTMISANHCPGSSLYLFEKVIGKKTNGQPRIQRVLHCGDFRACRMHIQHPLLMPDIRDKISGKTTEQKIDVCYLDTTYLNPRYAFPSQENVIKACADMCVSLSRVTVDETDGWEQMKRQRAGEGMVKFVRRESSGLQEEGDPTTANDLKLETAPLTTQQKLSSNQSQATRGRLLVVVGTYSIGKERICLGIARALNSKIWAPTGKQRIVRALKDPELDALMTTDPREAQVHMTPLFEIRAETLDDYLKDYWPHFTRAVGFRPSGWTYSPPTSRFTDSPTVQTVLHSDNWKSTFSMRELVPQRGSTSRASCFGVPYSEHSSFRELTMFCCALRIDKIIPTVNVGSAKSREKMKSWIERWQNEKKKNGLYALPEDGSW
ncbi:hypothetical protein AMS68_002696 [Peltaster fructicola]|uniref:DNA repair metallo-beta-lactamase domain-containing protein n=1 Tax=Peltaster fructicola TaxID=286661 RepID=A0A6H0XRC4_9PEZI|nr:hypothetical protein AMS68_002696 [Peltaster fructicola]